MEKDFSLTFIVLFIIFLKIIAFIYDNYTNKLYEKIIAQGESIAVINVKTDKNGNIKQTKLIKELGFISPKKISINRSSYYELLQCPKIGKKLAFQIVNERKISPFKSWQELKTRIKGIGDKKIRYFQKIGIKLK